MTATEQTTSITRQIALRTSYEMGRYAAQRGVAASTAMNDCPLVDLECRLHWVVGFNSATAR